MKKLTILIVALLLLLSFATITSAAVHSVFAPTPFLLIDGLTGTNYTNLSGRCSMNWNDATRYGFFNAKVDVLVPFISYEFQLISIGNASATEIEGLWDIYRNGVLVASGIVGKLYRLNEPVGSYFKFYGGDSQNNTNRWHLAAYISNRFDY
jgi:hypothetical protein